MKTSCSNFNNMINNPDDVDADEHISDLNMSVSSRAVEGSSKIEGKDKVGIHHHTMKKQRVIRTEMKRSSPTDEFHIGSNHQDDHPDSDFVRKINPPDGGLKWHCNQDNVVEIDCGGVGKDVKMEDKIIPLGIITRTSPKTLFNTVKQLNDEQKSAVREIGFESLLDMTLDGIPSKLGYYVVDNLDTFNMVMKLDNKQLPITIPSIHHLLGLPTGGIDLNSLDRSVDGTNMSGMWKEQFTKERMRPKDVMKVIQQSADAGPMFKINFLVIVVNILGECSPVGCCNIGFLSRINSVEMIPKVDWCKYVYDCVENSKRVWRRDSSTSFYSGPLTYLALLYVESTRCDRLRIPHGKSTLKSWTYDLLRRRQDIELLDRGLGFAELKGMEPGNGRLIHQNVKGESTGKQDSSSSHLSKEGLLGLLEKKLRELEFVQWEVVMLLSDGMDKYPGDNEFKLIEKKLSSMFKEYGCDTSQAKNADTPVHDNRAARTLGENKVSMAMVELTPVQPKSVIMEDMYSPLSQIWGSPTFHEEIDRLSNKKLEVGHPEEGCKELTRMVSRIEPYGSNNCKWKQSAIELPLHNVSSIRIEKVGDCDASSGEQVTHKQVMVIKEKKAMNETHMITFDDSAAPSFDLGFSPTQKQPVQEEDGMIKEVHKLAEPQKCSRRQVRLGGALKSPYVQRAVSFLVDTDETRMEDWMKKGLGVASEKLFQTKNGVTIKRYEMESLSDRVVVNKRVIDGWSMVLNEEEKLHNTDSPPRYFLRQTFRFAYYFNLKLINF